MPSPVSIVMEVGKYSDGSRLAQSLFNDTDYVRAHVDATTLSDQLFKVSGNIQNTRLAGQVTLYDLFTKDEIYRHWKKQNAWWYFNYGGYVHHAEKKQALQHQLLRNCFYCADTALKTKPTAIFHFTDETSFIPFVCLLGVNGYGLATDHLESLEKKGSHSKRKGGLTIGSVRWGLISSSFSIVGILMTRTY